MRRRLQRKEVSLASVEYRDVRTLTVNCKFSNCSKKLPYSTSATVHRMLLLNDRLIMMAGFDPISRECDRRGPCQFPCPPSFSSWFRTRGSARPP